MQENDPDTVNLVRPTPDERPLHEQWSEQEQANLGATLAAALEEVDAAPPPEPEAAPVGVLATGETVTADELEGMPWYEARVEVYVRASAPGDEYGVGGDKIAHTRAVTQAPSFNAAAPRLDMQLGEKWQQVLNMAPLADQAPSPDAPAPAATPGKRTEGWTAWTVATLALTIVGLMTLCLAAGFLLTAAVEAFTG